MDMIYLQVGQRNDAFGLEWSLMRIKWKELDMHDSNFTYIK